MYSLNDLHKAAGGEKRHASALYLRHQQTKDLIAEINRYTDLYNAINIKRGGGNQGTWVCKELVYSYAMWVSLHENWNTLRRYTHLQLGMLMFAEYKGKHSRCNALILQSIQNT